MFSRRWDPGITNGERIEGILGQIKVRTDTGRRFSSHHRCMIMEFRVDISEEIWKIGFVGEQNSISIIFKMKSIAFKGITFHSLQLSIFLDGEEMQGTVKPELWKPAELIFMDQVLLVSSKQWVGVFIFKISSMSFCLSLGLMGLEGFAPFMVFFTCLQWNDIVSLALWCCDSSWFLKAYGILLKLSIGKDSVVWVRLGMGTMTVDGSWTSLECMWVFFMLAWLVEVSCFNRRSARAIGSLWRFTRWYHACIVGFWCRCYYGLLGESRKVSSWVGAGGVDTQALSMWRDKIEFRFSFIKVFIWEMQGRMARDMNCVSLNTFIYLMGWQCWREYSHDGWNVVSRLLGFEGITVSEKGFNRVWCFVFLTECGFCKLYYWWQICLLWETRVFLNIVWDHILVIWIQRRLLNFLNETSFIRKRWKVRDYLTIFLVYKRSGQLEYLRKWSGMINTRKIIRMNGFWSMVGKGNNETKNFIKLEVSSLTEQPDFLF